MHTPDGPKKARWIDVLLAAATYLANHERMKEADPEIVKGITFTNDADAIYQIHRVAQRVIDSDPLMQLLDRLRSAESQIEIIPMPSVSAKNSA